MGQLFRESAREWLRAWLKLGIPVETGMAKASLVPLGRFLHGVGGLKIEPNRKPYYSKLERGVQSPELGEHKSYFDIQDDKSNPMRFVYLFEWYTETKHYFLSRYYKGQFVSGQAAITIAEQAFMNHFNSTLSRRLPKLDDFLKGD